LALSSPTGGGRSVGIVRSRTKATEFSLVLVLLITLFNFNVLNFTVGFCYVSGTFCI